MPSPHKPDPPQPLPDPTRDWLPIAIRFVVGAIFGGPFGLVSAMEASQSDALHLTGLLVGGFIGGLLSAWFGRRFWERVPLMRGWFVAPVSAATAVS